MQTHIEEVIDFDGKFSIGCGAISIALLIISIFLYGPVGFVPKTMFQYVIGIFTGVMVYSIIIHSKLKKLRNLAITGDQ